MNQEIINVRCNSILQVVENITINKSFIVENNYHYRRYFQGVTPGGGKDLAGFHICVNF